MRRQRVPVGQREGVDVTVEILHLDHPFLGLDINHLKFVFSIGFQVPLADPRQGFRGCADHDRTPHSICPARYRAFYVLKT